MVQTTNEYDYLASPSDRRVRTRLGLLAVVWGIQAIVTQSLLLREALVLMSGSELAWGVVLFAWLVGVALGAGAGGWWQAASWSSGRARNPDVALVIVLLTLSVVACAELWVFRGARAWLGVAPGELLPLPKTIAAAMLFVSPAGALVGMAFPLACGVGRAGNTRAVPATESPRRSSSEAGSLLKLGNVYSLESAGSLIGGAVFSFWAVEHLSPIQTALFCMVMTVAASAALLKTTRNARMTCVSLSGVAVAVLLIAIFAGEVLGDRLVLRRWADIAPGYELRGDVESKYQNLAVGERAGQFTLYCDGQVSADFPDPYTFAPLAHFWMCQHPDPRQVLVLGGGAEGLLAEILLHPVEQVVYVEPDPRLIDLIEPYLDEADRRALHDRRVTVHHRDARHFIKTRAGQFDLVIGRLPEPMSALRARLYTDEFFRELRHAMAPRAVLCMTATAGPGSLTTASMGYVGSIRATLGRHFPHITIGWGNPAHILAATESGLTTIDPSELSRRYVDRGVASDLFRPAWFDGATDWLDAEKVRRRADELDAASNVEISTDLRPIVYMQRLELWESATSRSHSPDAHRPAAAGSGVTGKRGWRLIAQVRSIRLAELAVVLVGIAGVTVLACYTRDRLGRRTARRDGAPVPGRSVAAHASGAWFPNSAIILSVGSTGFATMALSVVWLFAFQNLYGYVYQQIGWIIAVFMGGLVIGCEIVNRRSRRMRGRPPRGGLLCGRSNGAAGHFVVGEVRALLWRWIIAVDVLLALLALAVPYILPVLGGMPASPMTLALVEWCVLLMVAFTGVLGGAAFPLAGGLYGGGIADRYTAKDDVETAAASGKTAGVIVGVDHAGACLGALLCGIVLVPVFGTALAAYLLVGIKLSSAALLLWGRRVSRAV